MIVVEMCVVYNTRGAGTTGAEGAAAPVAQTVGWGSTGAARGQQVALFY